MQSQAFLASVLTVAVARASFAVEPVTTAPPVTATAETAVAEPVHISYDDRVGCSEPGAFWRDVVRRTSRIRSAEPGEPARHFWATIRRDSGRLRGSLIVREVDGRETRRQLDAATCTDMVDALSLIVALTVDPSASAEPAAAPVAPSPVPKPRPRPAPPSPSAPPPIVVAQNGRSWALWASAGGAMLFDQAPRAVPSAALALDADLRDARGSLLVLSFGARHARSGERAPAAGDGGSLEAVSTAGIFAICALPLGNRLGVMPCASVDVGVRRVAGLNVANARSESRAAVESAVYGQAFWQFAGPVQARVFGGVRAPLLRYRYTVGESVFEVPRFAPWLGLALALEVS